ncbi:hypothetical protein [Roseibium polysiphoniae]|uniref:Uncharacterized protein n=1 Tax=Roseibium polysiphoniae TaxID=2571221 RepID=A0ABR9C8F1_9HYPH|nr:hypothetical protein [Roseibium polysiphoniae]MBD8876192.1 hypothetical protein [Roseibium polysiphoniae]
MATEDEQSYEQFVKAFRRYCLMRRQLTVFQSKSKDAIRDQRYSDAEYCIAWIENLEVSADDHRERMLDAFDELEVVAQAEIVCLLKTAVNRQLQV